MAQIDQVLLEIEDYTTNSNSVKEIVLSRLLSDKIITKEQAQEYSEKWQVIIIKKNWFKRWMEKFSKEYPSTGTEYQFKYVRFED